VHVVAVVNRKGGVGKTTTAVNVAAALALAGQRTLLVDLDPQGSAGRALAVAADDGHGASGAFTKRPAWEVRYPARAELYRLGVVAADPELATVEHDLLGDARRRSRLGQHLATQRDHWALAILDTPPGLGGLGEAALRAADGVLVPVGADFLAVDALRSTLAAVRAVERARGEAYRPLAVLATFADERRPGAAAAVALLRDHFPELVLDRAVPRSARFDSGALAGVPVVVSAPASEPARAYVAAARALLGSVGRGPRRAPKRPDVKRFARADMRDALRSLRAAARSPSST
jgi:chromosome partitioning protein